ncbi:MAG: circularly permuted type 2 ATP-grasp protein [Verrucomicrobiota bacterium]|nr:circularly permuted type 2 ATP-grasp protein [Verrucomicrobiota bacterium]
MNCPSQPAAIPNSGPPRLFAAYQPLPKIYDESVGTQGIRPHWKAFASAFEKLGLDELNARWENGRKVIREHGVTYNVYGDPQGMDRPWELDTVPLLISSDEWRSIEEGLVQRARLINLVLQDIYGPQQLLRSGLIPPALIFANPAFLRPCHGIKVPDNWYVHLHACDLARSPDGKWWILADRTQAPSGTGYALENRIVLSRILPEEFRDCNVQRLARFFSFQREALNRLAPRHRQNPNIVLLTPGPHNETYFEHAYLASYLGFTLVEGGDLTVRDRTVYLKTLEGLQRVDVILRRVDDTFCDPLELRNDSFLGVPGLLDSVRAGNVTVSNALGSSLMESSAFLAFLPTLCQHLLGEELKIPSVATWWCGQAEEQKYVLQNLDKIVVKPAFGGVLRFPFFGRNLALQDREDLVDAITARPFEYVGQEQVAFSTAPAWAQNELEPRGVVVRAYVSVGQDSCSVMPGGLARISSRSGDPVVSMQRGGGSKDIWVLSDNPVEQLTLLLPSGQPIGAVRNAAELPSRVADNLFWLGRYAERLENALRLMRCVITRLSDESVSHGQNEFTVILQMLVILERIPRRLVGRVAYKELEHELMQLVYSSTRPGAIRELVLRMRQIASTVRDRFSADTWRILNQLQLDSRSRPGRLPLANALALINTSIIDLAAFSGMEMENMTRGHGWRFLDLGRRLERASNLAETCRAAFMADRTPSPVLWPLLEIADSTMTYRRRYFAQVQLQPVLDLLLADQGNPRSLVFQIHALKSHLANLPKPSLSRTGSESEGKPILPLKEPSCAAIEILTKQFLEQRREPLYAFLKEIETELSSLSDHLTASYFSLSLPRMN